MKLKRLISLLLISVYLFAVGGQALAPLTCVCVAGKAVHTCCHHCLHQDGPDSYQAPCCTHSHSNEVELYLRASVDNEDDSKCVVLDLPHALAAECPCPAHIPFLRVKVAERRTPFVREILHLTVGFRAPPVLA